LYRRAPRRAAACFLLDDSPILPPGEIASVLVREEPPVRASVVA
jgi:hypothetical protein